MTARIPSISEHSTSRLATRAIRPDIDRYSRGSNRCAAEERIKVMKPLCEGIGFGGGRAADLADPGEFRYHLPRHAQ